MPRTRRQAANNVADAFLPAKRDSVRAASAVFAAMSVMLTERFEVKMGANYAADILKLGRSAANAAFDMQEKMHEMHELLAPIRKDFNIPPGAFGPDDTPDEVLAPLRLLMSDLAEAG